MSSANSLLILASVTLRALSIPLYTRLKLRSYPRKSCCLAIRLLIRLGSSGQQTLYRCSIVVASHSFSIKRQDLLPELVVGLLGPTIEYPAGQSCCNVTHRSAHPGSQFASPAPPKFLSLSKPMSFSASFASPCPKTPTNFAVAFTN